MVKTGKLRVDAHQRRTVEHLQNLHEKLKSYSPSPAASSVSGDTSSSSWIFSWLNKKDEEDGFDLKSITGHTPKGLYLYGSVGTGKTMLMDLFYSSVKTDKKRRVHFHSFMLEVHQRLHQLKNDKGKSRSNYIDEVSREIVEKSWLLCFDEFQVTDIADAMILRSLLEGLFKRGCVLFITSNRHPDKLYWNGIQRKSFLPCIELLKQRMEVINLDTDYDYRQIERELDQVYYYPLSDAVAKTMDEVYERFLQGSESSDTELEVFGRKIKISQQNKDRKVARFTFNQLCQSAHSAADYLEIVKNYRVILLESVPVLDIHMKDSVRRFITLIDLMYENKVALVCSAEDTLENLFKVDSVSADDEVVFAFRRCLSRLKEMQSKDWMSK